MGPFLVDVAELEALQLPRAFFAYGAAFNSAAFQEDLGHFGVELRSGTFLHHLDGFFHRTASSTENARL